MNFSHEWREFCPFNDLLYLLKVNKIIIISTFYLLVSSKYYYLFK